MHIQTVLEKVTAIRKADWQYMYLLHFKSTYSVLSKKSPFDLSPVCFLALLTIDL